MLEGFGLILTVSIVVILLGMVIFFFARYQKCPSDRILVIYGKTGKGQAAKCLHGGAAFVWPVIQAFEYLDLTPIQIEIPLDGALSKQNIRVNTPSSFTVGISTDPGVMTNAAERLLGQPLSSIQALASDIIFGQMRVVIATMDIEAINADRDQLIERITSGVEGELTKVGLKLINVNIKDITDDSGYLDALGKEAASRATNDAKIQVAQRERDGNIGEADAQREQRIQVSAAQAQAVEGENLAKVKVAESDALRREREAEAERMASAAEKVKQAQALEEAYASERTAEEVRAQREKATQHANVVVPAEIEKAKIETLAEADAEKIRRLKKGEADGIQSLMEAEAKGTLAALQAKAQGFGEIVQSSGGEADDATLLLVTEQLPQLIEEQVKAISNLKIDSVTVWDSGKGEGGKNDTANFMSGLVGALPPLHALTKNVGIELPEFLGKLGDDPAGAAKIIEQAKAKTVDSAPQAPESEA
ncbi:MAG: SPFH domain-containing protein [Verrucomicrobiota bacterium]|nr:SPFH domain-containing protein [Verrucomicrobiota bacterium]